jgi:hypothetical protein
MARPTKFLRLSQIDPEDLAKEVEDHVVIYVQKLLLRLTPGYSVRMGARHGDTDLSLSTRDLAAYAVRGDPLDAPVEEYVQSLVEALWPRPVDEGTYHTPELSEALESNLDSLEDNLANRVSLVVAAAEARQSLAQGDGIDAAELGALAGCTEDHVRLVLRSEPSPLAQEKNGDSRDPLIRVTAQSAIAWLEARGVPGFGRRR